MMVKPFKLVKSKDKQESPGACASMCTPMDEKSELSNDSVDNKRKFKIKVMSKIKTKLFLKPKTDRDDVTLPVVMDFNQNLQQHRLAEADRQLLERELFVSESSDEPRVYSEDDEDRLQVDYERLMLQLWIAIEDSFNKENQEILRSAVTTILQEEQRDIHWMKLEEKQRPRWRPLRCRQIHDTLLKKVVEVRLQQAREEESRTCDLTSSLKAEVYQMGKLLQRDLVLVVKDAQGCYSPEFDVCNLYAQLYHQAFSTRLMELARSNIDLKEQAYILTWINTFYPKDVLQQQELESHINRESLGDLLPKEDLRSLEESYLSYTEAMVRTWLSNALKKEEEGWQSDQALELNDGHFFSNLSFDIIHIVDGVMKESLTVLGNEDKCQRILCQLDGFLVSYKKSIDDLIYGKQKNVSDIVKANLVSIKQLREHIEERQDLQDNVKAALLSKAADLRDNCHTYLLSPIHSEFKEQYRTLWTQAWLSGSHEVTGDLVGALEEKFQKFTNLKSSCREDLLSQLHFEVMVEYVKRMLKRKLKLKGRVEQETAARCLCEDSVKINRVFTANGSREKWLSDVLPKLSEVLRLQDTGILQLEVAILARAYPDLSERHIFALLQLKSNLSSSDMRRIRNSLTENKDASNSEPVPQFFSKVPLKQKFI